MATRRLSHWTREGLTFKGAAPENCVPYEFQQAMIAWRCGKSIASAYWLSRAFSEKTKRRYEFVPPSFLSVVEELISGFDPGIFEKETV